MSTALGGEKLAHAVLPRPALSLSNRAGRVLLMQARQRGRENHPAEVLGAVSCSQPGPRKCCARPRLWSHSGAQTIGLPTFACRTPLPQGTTGTTSPLVVS